MRETSGVTARIAAAMTRAQSGSPAEAALELNELLAELDPEPSHERAAAEYVRAVAAHHATDAVEALDAVDGCIRVARAINCSTPRPSAVAAYPRLSPSRRNHGFSVDAAIAPTAIRIRSAS